MLLATLYMFLFKEPIFRAFSLDSAINTGLPHNSRVACLVICLFFFILLTHEGLHREVYQEFQPSYDIFHRSGAKGCSDHMFCALPAYTAQLLTLHQHTSQQTV